MDCPTLNVDHSDKVNDVLRPLLLSQQDVDKIADIFEQELEKGMVSGLADSSLQMENTFVPEMTNGTENGTFLALDLGGTNFRVILLDIKDGKIVKEEVSYYSVEESKRLGPGEDLFDFLASCIIDFVKKLNLPVDVVLPLGFTFSFPMTQNALDCGILVSWTKSFNCPGVVGTDAVKQLNDALARVGKGNVRVKVVAILNDTTGTLVKGAYDNPETCIGLILGTGCNGAYLERASNVVRWGEQQKRPKEVIVDPEFGAFGDNGCIDFISSEFDKTLDRESLLPKSFTFEKYFAGKYIGEVARLILVELHEKNLLFKGLDISSLRSKNSFEASDLSEVELDTMEAETNRCQVILGRLNLSRHTSSDVAILKHVCSIVTHRGTLLVSIPLATFIKRMEKPNAAIAVTGSLYKHHPRFKELLERYIARNCGGYKFYTFLSDDGSGKGAGLVAAIADRIGSAK